MKVLVTGATGFLGKYVVEELVAHGYTVRAFGRNQKIGQQLQSSHVEFFQGDLTKKEDVLDACKGVDLVVHAGALSTIWGSWEDFYRTNVVGTQLVLDACKYHNVQRLVYISSPSIYAKACDQLNIKESDAPKENTLNYYIKSKLMAEELIHQTPQVETVTLRPRGLFGIGDTSIFPRVLHLSQKIGIPLIRGGNQLMDMTCVENVALAVRLALESSIAGGQTYNISNGEPRTFKSMLDEVFDCLEFEKHYRHLPSGLLSCLAHSCEAFYRFFKIQKEPPLTVYTYYLLRYSQTLDISKAETELGYHPYLSISEGIEKYVQNYRKH
ncbi:MAG: NAD(P)-dependent oxidoreductase [Streptococcus sp.]|nr:NAD(P)-dependent oxidoreductase [Streptococcus sp.]